MRWGRILGIGGTVGTLLAGYVTAARRNGRAEATGAQCALDDVAGALLFCCFVSATDIPDHGGFCSPGRGLHFILGPAFELLQRLVLDDVWATP